MKDPNPDQKDRVQAAFNALRDDVHWKIITDYLQECLLDTVGNLAKPIQEEWKLRFLQGELSVLLKLKVYAKRG